MKGYLALIAIWGVFYGAAQSRGEDWVTRAREVAAQRLHAAAHRQTDQPQTATGDASRDQVQYLFASGFSGRVQLTAASPADETAAAQEPAAQAPATQSVEIQRGPLPTLGETIRRDVREMWGDLWNDTKAVYWNPWNVLFLVGAGGASLALRPEVDDDIEDHYRHNHTYAKGFRDFMDAAGNPATGFIVAGTWYLAGQILQDAKTYEVGKRLASALIITDLSTLLLKTAAWTRAPNDLPMAWPSGHVSSTMALATVLHDAYGPLVGVPMYTLTVFSAWERLDSREHHFSDVIFGAALGWVVAHQVMKEHQPEIFGGEIVPYVSSDGSMGIGWLKTFD